MWTVVLHVKRLRMALWLNWLFLSQFRRPCVSRGGRVLLAYEHSHDLAILVSHLGVVVWAVDHTSEEVLSIVCLNDVVQLLLLLFGYVSMRRVQSCMRIGGFIGESPSTWIVTLLAKWVRANVDEGLVGASCLLKLALLWLLVYEVQIRLLVLSQGVSSAWHLRVALFLSIGYEAIVVGLHDQLLGNVCCIPTHVLLLAHSFLLAFLAVVSSCLLGQRRVKPLVGSELKQWQGRPMVNQGKSLWDVNVRCSVDVKNSLRRIVNTRRKLLWVGVVELYLRLHLPSFQELSPDHCLVIDSHILLLLIDNDRLCTALRIILVDNHWRIPWLAVA